MNAASSTAQHETLVTPTHALAFIHEHGIVLESSNGPVPSIARIITGSEIKGSWWSHPKGKEIFRITRAVRASPHVLVCRLVSRKITFVHERLWPALVRVADGLDREQLSQLVEEHTGSGKHVTREIPFPAWVPASVAAQARALGKEQAADMLEAIVPGLLSAR
ncbi:MAG: hypothetical protein SXG53_26475 [Pseudomonadota bacterium]|nr:hypothetical protein [Pseudomonadota bacterium]